MVFWFCCKTELRADVHWYQPAVAAFDNIYGSMYCHHDVESFEDGTFLSQILNGNIEPNGVAVYLDFGYFTEDIEAIRAFGRLPEGYQLPKTFYTIGPIGGTYKAGAYNAPYIATNCPEGMDRYLAHVERYAGIESGKGGLFRNYVPKYIREANGEIGECTHEYTSFAKIKPTCACEGLYRQACVLCGYGYDEVVAKTQEHQYEMSILKEVTCGEDGELMYKCSTCGISYSEVVSKTGEHTYSLIGHAESTCAAEGKDIFGCDVCGEEYTEILTELKEHTYKKVVEREPSCEEDGLRRYTCDECKKTYTEPMPKQGHKCSEWKTVEENTWFSDGLNQISCLTCNEVLEEQIIPSKYPIWVLYSSIGVGTVCVGCFGILTGRKLWKKKQ